jgi:hypothetical protein
MISAKAQRAASQSPASPSGRRAVVIKLSILTISILLVLGALEVLIRMTLPYYNPRNQFFLHRNEEDVVLGPSCHGDSGHAQGDFLTTNRFNRHGFRDTKDFSEAKPTDVFVAGDSFSMGWGVEENERYSNLLESHLKPRIFNLAIPEDIAGYERTLKYVEKQGAPVHNLIIGLCMENDLGDYRQTWRERGAADRKQNLRSIRHRIAYWFKGHSALWVCSSHTLQRNGFLRGVFEKLGISKNIDELTHKNDGSPEVLLSSKNHLLKIATNYNPVVLIIPSRGLWHGSNIATEERVHEQFVHMLREAGLRVLDMKPLLEQSGHPLGYYFRNDPHWNAHGTRRLPRLCWRSLLKWSRGNPPRRVPLRRGNTSQGSPLPGREAERLSEGLLLY